MNSTKHSHAQQIVQRLWNYCSILRDDGLSYPDYVEQLTYLVFLKMMSEREGDIKIIPKTCGWDTLVKQESRTMHALYTRILERLGKEPGMLGLIYTGAKNRIQDPAKLHRLVTDLIDRENWSQLDTDVAGDAYEGLLEKTSRDSKSGAGQYFTPRALIRAVVAVLDPKPSESVCDPACGTCGFLLGVREHVLQRHSPLTASEAKYQKLGAYWGQELVQSVASLGAMNLLLHGIGPTNSEGEPPIAVVDSLIREPTKRFDLVLTNPPFGRKSSVRISKEDTDAVLTAVRADFWTTTANKQLSFLQHVRSLLKPGGRAAVVLPDNVLFEGGAGEIIRRNLLEECDVHTLLRLPTGLFYAQGVKANVLFFERRRIAPDARVLWVYDLRTNLRFSLKNRQLSPSDLSEFVGVYGGRDRADRTPTWKANRPLGRWRAFSFQELSERGKWNLDLSWIPDDNRVSPDSLPTPDALTREVMRDLKAALRELEQLSVSSKKSSKHGEAS